MSTDQPRSGVAARSGATRRCLAVPLAALVAATVLIACENGPSNSGADADAARIAGAWGAGDRQPVANEIPRGQEPRMAYLHRVGRAYAEWQLNNVASAEALLDACPTELRGWEWHYVRRLCRPELIAFGPNRFTVPQPAPRPPTTRPFDEDKTTFDGGLNRALVYGAGRLSVWDVAKVRQVTNVSSPAFARKLEYDPAGHSFYGFVDRESDRDEGANPPPPQQLIGLDGESGKERFRVDVGAVDFGHVAASPDGRRLGATYAHRGRGGQPVPPCGVKVWDAAHGRELLDVDTEGYYARTVHFSPDGQRIAACTTTVADPDKPGLKYDKAGGLRVWEVATGRQIARFVGTRSNGFAFGPDGRHLLAEYSLAAYEQGGAVTKDRTLQVLDVDGGKLVAEMPRYEGGDWDAGNLAFAPDGKLVAGTLGDGGVVLWRPFDEGRPMQILRGHTKLVHAIAFSPDGTRLATGGQDNLVKVWRLPAAVEEMTLRGHAATVTAARFSADGRRLATFSRGWSGGPESKVWDLASASGVVRVDAGVPRGGNVYVTFGPGNQTLWVSRGDAPPKVVNLDPSKEDARAAKPLVLQSEVVGGELCFSPDGRLVARAGAHVELFAADTGKPLGTLRNPHRERYKGAFVSGLAFSADGARLAGVGVYMQGIGGNEADAGVWDTATGQVLHEIRAPGGEAVTAVAFSSDGKHLAVASSPTGCMRMSGDHGHVTVVDAASGGVVARLDGGGAGVAFSGDGRLLVSGTTTQLSHGYEGTVDLWTTADRKPAGTLRGHNGWVSDVDITADGTRIASVGLDRVVRLWDVATGEQILALPGHSRDVHHVAFSGDGQLLVSVANGRSDAAPEVFVWDARPLGARP